jgi:hypothetical protein
LFGSQGQLAWQARTDFEQPENYASNSGIMDGDFVELARLKAETITKPVGPISILSSLDWLNTTGAVSGVKVRQCQMVIHFRRLCNRTFHAFVTNNFTRQLAEPENDIAVFPINA